MKQVTVAGMRVHEFIPVKEVCLAGGLPRGRLVAPAREITTAVGSATIINANTRFHCSRCSAGWSSLCETPKIYGTNYCTYLASPGKVLVVVELVGILRLVHTPCRLQRDAG